MKTHELADTLERLAAALRREPDQPLGDLLKGLGVERPRRRRIPAQPAVDVTTVDLSQMSREEMEEFLKGRTNFRTKKDLVAFLRAREVAVTEKMRTRDIRDHALRILHDIPRSRDELRRYGTTAQEEADG